LWIGKGFVHGSAYFAIVTTNMSQPCDTPIKKKCAMSAFGTIARVNLGKVINPC